MTGLVIEEPVFGEVEVGAGVILRVELGDPPAAMLELGLLTLLLLETPEGVELLADGVMGGEEPEVLPGAPLFDVGLLAGVLEDDVEDADGDGDDVDGGGEDGLLLVVLGEPDETIEI